MINVIYVPWSKDLKRWDELALIHGDGWGEANPA